MILLDNSDTFQGGSDTNSAITITIWGVEVTSSGESLKKLYQGQLTNSVAALYTAGASTQTLIRSIQIVNTSGGAATVALYHDGSTAAFNILPDISLGASESIFFGADGWKFYDSDGRLKVVQTTGTSTITVQEGDSTVDASVSTLDFGAGFDVTSSPAGEANVTLDATEVVAAPQTIGTANADTGAATFSSSAHVHANNLTAVDFLVGTATGQLSGEIVVGTTPGGELGGTWGSPTVDSVHSGSAHHTQSHDHSAAGDGTALVPESLEITGGPLSLRGDISPAQITSTQNNYNPTGLADAIILRLDLDTARSITGLAGGADGRVIIIHNLSLFELTLVNNSGSSDADKRFWMGTDQVVSAISSAILIYDSTISNWRLVSIARQPYQSTPAADTIAGSTGSSGRWARGDHSHPYGVQEHVAIWTISGTLPASSSGTMRWYNDTGRTLTFIKARASVGTAPSGGSVVADIEDSGGTSVLGANLTITTGNNTDTETSFAGGGTIADGAYLTMDLDSTTAPAANLVVQLLMRG